MRNQVPVPNILDLIEADFQKGLVSAKIKQFSVQSREFNISHDLRVQQLESQVGTLTKVI
jgi:hypothetical protein